MGLDSWGAGFATDFLACLAQAPVMPTPKAAAPAAAAVQSEELRDESRRNEPSLAGDALPAPSAPAGRAGPAGSFEPARTETERVLAAMLAEVLDVPDVGRNDDFFSLGGDSILAVQAAARARDAGLALTARMVFEHPEIHELAATIDDADGAPQAADVRHEPMAASGLSPDELAAVTSMFTSARDGAP